ncbi:MAG TPA: ATP-binding protein [Phycisphaerae bacterium]
MNRCPCGYFTDPRKPCKCTPPQIDKYLARMSLLATVAGWQTIQTW